MGNACSNLKIPQFPAMDESNGALAALNSSLIRAFGVRLASSEQRVVI